MKLKELREKTAQEEIELFKAMDEPIVMNPAVAKKLLKGGKVLKIYPGPALLEMPYYLFIDEGKLRQQFFSGEYGYVKRKGITYQDFIDVFDIFYFDYISYRIDAYAVLTNFTIEDMKEKSKK